MKTFLSEFKQRWTDTVLDFTWRSWTALGVPGHIAGHSLHILDPEALILFTCTVGRYDPRIFDEMLDWIKRHERLINIQRLNTLIVNESFSGGPVVSALANFMGRPTSASKWRRLAQDLPSQTPDEALFFMADGRPLPVVQIPEPSFAKASFLRDAVVLRQQTQTFDPNRPETLLLKLRALFGVNSRADLVALLLGHEPVNASEAARLVRYFQRTAYNTLVEMALSDLLHVTERGHERRYSLDSKAWMAFLRLHAKPIWVNWPSALSVIERIWLKVHEPEWSTREPMQLALDLHLLITEVRSDLQAAQLDLHITAKPGGDDAAYVKECLQNFEDLLANVDDGRRKGTQRPLSQAAWH